jgi:glycosyltransferase involved in cell wall biosynthesis
MKIAVISTTVMVVPPPGYSGLEMLAWQQADGLAKRGHQILLVAPKGSTAPSGVEIHETTLGESEQQAYSGYWHRLPNYDAVIDNSWQKWAYILKAEGKLKAPVLGVMHAPAETMFGSSPPVDKPCFVAISRDQAGAVCGHLGHRARVCYNGVDFDFYKSNGAPKTDRYLFLARMSKLKGPHVAVQIAKHCGVPVDLVGDDKLVESPPYAAMVRSGCDGKQIVYLGEKGRKECVTYFSQAKALLHCNFVFREPFGLSPVEAQGCGCPVIATEVGAMRETVKHGETGFLVRTPEEMEDLIKTNAVADISPKKCRAWAEQFSVQNMVLRYEELCKEAIEKGGW